ncbi:DUF6482 family protein [Pseudoalteromonas sp. MMG022]|uniref:DUF6482 family protein n=1 Tax=Pseudoalteromonas sp. MMG022 TaxID=2909978 RepID=UPI001F4536F6|nr:DUF6482 family protein [Pseudoalteromonas sp. MMG022]MCF6437692.1 DUF6482 family protein [Pseudoalteromonas sp. MMG022]
MLESELKIQLSQFKLDAVILSYADANHYLAGGVDIKGNYHLLTNKHGETQTFNSLREAEVALAGLGVTAAIFEMQSAYDEMVASDTASTVRTKLHLVH